MKIKYKGDKNFIVCTYCKYEWEPRVFNEKKQTPKACPRCHAYLKWDKQ